MHSHVEFIRRAIVSDTPPPTRSSTPRAWCP